MKFPRNTQLLKSPFEIAPFAAVFFLFAMFLFLVVLMPTPGIPLELPAAGNLPGPAQPTVAVAVDAAGRLYFANQMVTESQLRSKFAGALKQSGPALTLVIEADQSVTYQQLVQLTMLANKVGIHHALLAALPRPEDTGRP